MEQRMALRKCDLSHDEDDSSGNGNLKGGEQDKGANTGEGKEPVRPDKRGQDDDNQSEDDDNQSEDADTTALKWLPMCSQLELATERVSPLSGI